MTSWTRDGAPVRLLCNIDNYAREALAIGVKRRIGARVVVESQPMPC